MVWLACDELGYLSYFSYFDLEYIPVSDLWCGKSTRAKNNGGIPRDKVSSFQTHHQSN